MAGHDSVIGREHRTQVSLVLTGSAPPPAPRPRETFITALVEPSVGHHRTAPGRDRRIAERDLWYPRSEDSGPPRRQDELLTANGRADLAGVRENLAIDRFEFAKHRAEPLQKIATLGGVMGEHPDPGRSGRVGQSLRRRPLRLFEVVDPVAHVRDLPDHPTLTRRVWLGHDAALQLIA
jgi:hypothetical protein